MLSKTKQRVSQKHEEKSKQKFSLTVITYHIFIYGTGIRYSRQRVNISSVFYFNETLHKQSLILLLLF